ncbi:hypothetical protein LRS73_35385 (plasmid) [Methylobacterium currus]|nr:hypothetical protein [Methylobacterium currus]UHC20421.1 hypothetical protein LRS73_35385 [Methylobacterium currus]
MIGAPLMHLANACRNAFHKAVHDIKDDRLVRQIMLLQKQLAGPGPGP